MVVMYAVIMIGSMIASTLVIEGTSGAVTWIKNKKREKGLQNG